MGDGNDTIKNTFILVGHDSRLRYPVLAFLLVLFIYVCSLIGNTLLIVIVKKDARLHKPMYFFLGNLALQEMCYTAVTVPTILMILLRGFHVISIGSCIAQIYFLHCLGCTECIILAVMAYDRYAAICRPLHYSMLVNKNVCTALVIGSWTYGCIDSLIMAIMTSQLRFCGHNKVKNFFCDIPPLLSLACTDTRPNKIVLSIAGFLVPCLFLFIMVTYCLIGLAILRIQTNQERRKAFSTCSSHLIVVCMFYGAVVFMYIRPTSVHSSDWDILVSLVYTVLTPMLNPIIYSFRNKEIKEGMKRNVCKRG